MKPSPRQLRPTEGRIQPLFVVVIHRIALTTVRSKARSLPKINGNGPREMNSPAAIQTCMAGLRAHGRSLVIHWVELGVVPMDHKLTKFTTTQTAGHDRCKHAKIMFQLTNLAFPCPGTTGSSTMTLFTTLFALTGLLPIVTEEERSHRGRPLAHSLQGALGGETDQIALLSLRLFRWLLVEDFNCSDCHI